MSLIKVVWKDQKSTSKSNTGCLYQEHGQEHGEGEDEQNRQRVSIGKMSLIKVVWNCKKGSVNQILDCQAKFKDMIKILDIKVYQTKNVIDKRGLK